MQVSGLSSGLDVSSIVSQLMAAERRAGAGLTTNKATSNALANALQRLNTLVSDMGKAAKAIKPDTIFNTSPWSATQPTSSNAGVATATTSTAGTPATPGTYSFTVSSVAKAGSSVGDKGFAAATTAVGTADFSFDVVKGGAATTIDVKAGDTLEQVAKKITDSDAGISASVVTKADGQSYLSLTSKTTGAASDVSLAASAELGGSLVVTKGADTEIAVGDAGAPGAYTVTSSTNKVEGFIAGVTITAVKADPTTPVTLEVKQDVSGISDKVKAMVSSANSVLSNISINSKFDSSQKYSSSNPMPPYVGESTTRELTYKVQNVFVGSADALPNDVGIKLTREGALEFDQDAFAKAYAADPAKVEKTVTALATKLEEVGKQATNAADGTLTVRIQGEQTLVKDYTRQITAFEERMSLRQQTLERQFASLETMLSKLQSQGNWLSGQLKSLPTPSSNN